MEYILHVGMAKTGSTSLQRALSDNRESLRQHGVIYPKTGLGRGGTKHNRLHRVLCSGAAPESVGMPVDWIERFHSETVGADICVLSNEVVSSRDRDPEAFASLIPREQTRVVLYVREPVAHTISYYQHCIQHTNMTMSLQDFARSPRLQYFSEAERWSRVFGRENVMIRLYCRDDGSWDIVSDFSDVIGLKREDAFPSLENREYVLKPGMAGNLLLVKRALNHFITLEENRTIKEEIEELIGSFSFSV